MMKRHSTINDHIVSDRKILQIRKNQFDATAALVYGLNISLIHFALFVMTAFIVKWPDIEKAKRFDRAYDGDLFESIGRVPNYIDSKMESITCEVAAQDFRVTLVHMSVLHYTLVIINLFREMYDSTLGSLGMWMRCFEVICIGAYMFGLIFCLHNISIMEYWRFLSRKHPEHIGKFRGCFLDEGDWSGTALQISYIEVTIYFVNMLTMVMLILKSRCKKVGIDNDE